MKLSELLLNRFLYRDSSQSSETQDSSVVSMDASGASAPGVASGNAATDINTGSVPVNTTQLDGEIPAELMDIADLGWTQTSTFSVTDLNTVSWGAGTFTSAKGTSYSILAGNTGNMAAKTYVYLDVNVSTTAYQITTSQTAVLGPGKVLVAVCQNGTSAATYILVQATQIVADNMIVNTLSAISADLGTIIAGLVTGAVIQTASSGLRLIMSGPNNSYEFRSGSTLLAELKAMAVPGGGGAAGFVLQHGTQNCGVSVYGQEIGAGSRFVSIFTDAGTYYFDVVDPDFAAGYVDSNMDITTSGALSASNFSGDSSGSNTGDQDLSGFATLTGDNLFEGANTFDGSNEFTNYNLFSFGNEFTGDNLFSGVNTFSDETDGNYFNWIKATGTAPQIGLSTDRFYVYGNTVRYTTLINDSDEKLKKNMSSIVYGLKEIESISPIKYEYKQEDIPGAHLGFTAQDIEKSMPELVSEDEGNKCLATIELIPVLVRAVQELSEKIKNLESKLPK